MGKYFNVSGWERFHVVDGDPNYFCTRNSFYQEFVYRSWSTYFSGIETVFGPFQT